MELLSPRMIKLLGLEENHEAKELLEFNLHTLRILGLWKWDVPTWKYYRAFALLSIISLVIFNASIICDAYINITDLDHLTKLLISLVFVCLLTFKNIYLLLRTDEAFDVIDQLQNRFFTPDRPPTFQQTIILNRYAARAKLYTIIRSNLALGLMTFWLLYPIKEMLGEFAEEVDVSEEGNDVIKPNNTTFILQLPFIAYYPYDVEHNFLNYILTYLYQIFCGLSFFIGMPAWDMLFVSVFIHTSGHFKALQHNLLHLKEEARYLLGLHKAVQLAVNNNTWSIDGVNFELVPENSQGKEIERNRREMQVVLLEKQLTEEMEHILINCIQHHQIILRFVQRLEGLLKPVMLMQLLVSVIAFCVIGFQMSVIPIHTEGIKFVKLSVSLVSALVEQGMFYWFGGELLDESARTVNAAYHCEWYTTNVKFRKNLRLLMERAKRPVKLTAGGFSPLTLESFASVIQSSYSYFTMLKAVHDKDTD